MNSFISHFSTSHNDIPSIPRQPKASRTASLQQQNSFTQQEPKMATGYVQYSRHSLPYPTDHWSKIKIKSFRRTQLPTGNVIVLCAPEVATVKARRHSLDVGQLNRSGLVSRGTGNAYLNREMNSQLPPLTLSRHLSTPGPDARERPRRISSATTTQDRARMGFKYWVDEGKASGKMSNKVTMGCRGTFLGMGVPRL